jgi:hypothetical protein
VIHAIVNAAAEAYCGVIPTDRWREPYMPMDELETEIAAGVELLEDSPHHHVARLSGEAPHECR